MLLPRWVVLLVVAVSLADKYDGSSLYSISSEFGTDALEANCEDEVHLCELKSAGWYIAHDIQLTGPCTIERRATSSLTATEFISEYAHTKPVIITGGSDQSEFKYHSTKARLLEKYSNEEIVLSTANTYSYTRVKMSVQEYIDQYMVPQTLETRANKILYYFGDNDREGWKELFSKYKFPYYEIPSLRPEISFGMAGPGSGVAFHFHGPTFAETIYGRKRWFLYSPQVQPHFDPNNTTLHWLHHVYPSLPDHMKPFECTLLPGEDIELTEITAPKPVSIPAQTSDELVSSITSKSPSECKDATEAGKLLLKDDLYNVDEKLRPKHKKSPLLNHRKSAPSVVQTDKDSEHSITNYNPQQPEPSTDSLLINHGGTSYAIAINLQSSMQQQLHDEEPTLAWHDNHFGDSENDENDNPVNNKSFVDLMHGVGDDILAAIGNACMPNSNEDLYEIQQNLELLTEVYSNCQHVESTIKQANRVITLHSKKLIKLMDKLSAAKTQNVTIDIPIDAMLQKVHLQESGGSRNIDRFVQAVKKLNKAYARSHAQCNIM